MHAVGQTIDITTSPALCVSTLQSVVNYDVAPPAGVCHWQVHLEDSESANLIAELPAAVTWLERAMRQKGCKVLVHCNAGVPYCMHNLHNLRLWHLANW